MSSIHKKIKEKTKKIQRFNVTKILSFRDLENFSNKRTLARYFIQCVIETKFR